MEWPLSPAHFQYAYDTLIGRRGCLRLYPFHTQCNSPNGHLQEIISLVAIWPVHLKPVVQMLSIRERQEVAITRSLREAFFAFFA